MLACAGADGNDDNTDDFANQDVHEDGLYCHSDYNYVSE